MTDPTDESVAGSPGSSESRGPAFALGPHEPVTIVLADANVLYGRCVRDYLMYADRDDLIHICWSERILAEMARNQVKNIDSFTSANAQRLCDLMNAAAPEALVEPTIQDFAPFEHVDLSDEDDRHVLAAAIAAEADALCTFNIKHFPAAAMEAAGVIRVTPDQLFCALIDVHPAEMLDVHRTAVRKSRHATDESTLAALRRSECGRTAERVAALIAVHGPTCADE